MKNMNMDHKVFNGMEIPLQKLMELNIKTLQGMSYLKTSELLNIKKPEDMFARHMNVLIQNSQMALNYMRDTFNILENHWFNLSLQTEESAEKVMHHASSAAKKTLQSSSSTAKSTLKKVVSSAKKTVSSAKPKAKLAAKPAKKVGAKPAAKSVAKSVAKPAAKKAVSKLAAKPAAKKASVKSAPKAGMKKVASKTAKPATHKPSASHSSHSAKPEMRMMSKSHEHGKDSGNMPKVGGLTEKSGVKDLGLLNKGPNFHN